MRLILNLVLTTIVSAIISCTLVGLYNTEDQGLVIYFIVMALGNIFLPLFITVFIYGFFENFINTANNISHYMVGVSFMLLISALGLMFMTFFGATSVKISDLRDKFNSSYKGFLPIVIVYSFLVPLVYSLLQKRFTNKYS